LGIGDWGLGIGDWGLGPMPNPQYPIPNDMINNKIIIIFFSKKNILKIYSKLLKNNSFL
jgi:hypothetical protein